VNKANFVWKNTAIALVSKFAVLQMLSSLMAPTNVCVEQINVRGITVSVLQKKAGVQRGHSAPKRMEKPLTLATVAYAVLQTVKGTTCIA
jgi:hypothetical protein